MTTLKRATIALAVHAAFFLLLWAWKGEGMDGAGNLLKAWCAVAVVLTLFLVNQHKDSDPVVPAALPFGLGLWLHAVRLGALLWFGHWVMVLGFGFTVLMYLGMRNRNELHAAARQNDAQKNAAQGHTEGEGAAPRAA